MAKEKKVPVIFICDDLKEDWWWSPSDTTLGPRPELIYEFISETGRLFWMYSLDRFMKCSRRYIHIEVKEETIKEAKEYRVDEEKRIKETEFLRSYLQAVSIASEALGNIDPKVLEGLRQATYVDPMVLEGLRQATYVNPTVLESIRQATCFNPTVLESLKYAMGQYFKVKKDSDATTEMQQDSDTVTENKGN